MEQQKSIFNPFFTAKHTGTGLGLDISHRIVSRHGGLISFESVPGVGTTFTVTVELPAAPESCNGTYRDSAIGKPCGLVEIFHAF